MKLGKDLWFADVSDPPTLAPKITDLSHADTLPAFVAMRPGLVRERLPAQGQGSVCSLDSCRGDL